MNRQQREQGENAASEWVWREPVNLRNDGWTRVDAYERKGGVVAEVRNEYGCTASLDEFVKWATEAAIGLSNVTVGSAGCDYCDGGVRLRGERPLTEPEQAVYERKCAERANDERAEYERLKAKFEA